MSIVLENSSRKLFNDLTNNFVNYNQELIERAAEAWFEKEVLSRIRRRNYGFVDRTGRLRRSIIDSITSASSNINLNIRSNVDYASVIEFGHNSRYSFVRRAIRESIAKLQSYIDAEVRSENII